VTAQARIQINPQSFTGSPGINSARSTDGDHRATICSYFPDAFGRVPEGPETPVPDSPRAPETPSDVRFSRLPERRFGRRSRYRSGGLRPASASTARASRDSSSRSTHRSKPDVFPRGGRGQPPSDSEETCEKSDFSSGVRRNVDITHSPHAGPRARHLRQQIRMVGHPSRCVPKSTFRTHGREGDRHNVTGRPRSGGNPRATGARGGGVSRGRAGAAASSTAPAARPPGGRRPRPRGRTTPRRPGGPAARRGPGGGSIRPRSHRPC
jgi:hypothetical protein